MHAPRSNNACMESMLLLKTAANKGVCRELSNALRSVCKLERLKVDPTRVNRTSTAFGKQCDHVLSSFFSSIMQWPFLALVLQVDKIFGSFWASLLQEKLHNLFSSIISSSQHPDNSKLCYMSKPLTNPNAPPDAPGACSSRIAVRSGTVSFLLLRRHVSTIPEQTPFSRDSVYSAKTYLNNSQLPTNYCDAHRRGTLVVAHIDVCTCSSEQVHCLGTAAVYSQVDGQPC
jgi:hypothetical protein